METARNCCYVRTTWLIFKVHPTRVLLPNATVTSASTARIEDGTMPLIIACEKGHVDAARLLLDKGAEVDRATKKGTTPLAIAEERGHSSIVALLEAPMMEAEPWAPEGET